ncbi:DEAD/DEAH box helicase [Brevibacillus dissolubilis]|uniref:DEAD/DEAH box helicase n=1 Tax=Brevibacillus dissolubilis TaxID=1844116 RepID=UPI0011179438|nr:DEAD/DEAH box helicase [Brevibacillus dissolubilis]
MNPFSLLSKPMQKKIWDMKWEQFTPIQEQAIPAIIQTKKHMVISSATASGKTEAAFLPLLTLIENTGETALKVLYISPLKALINNQFERIEKLCEHIRVPLHRWHGDVGQHQKKKFIQAPTGILQITPESIESLFINRTEFLRAVFTEVEFIVIDEIHTFLDTERGVQLRSLISRLAAYSKVPPRIIGLSATVDNFAFVKSWIDPFDQENVEIIEAAGSGKDLHFHLMHLGADETGKKPIELFTDIRELTRNSSSIIFCNSRGEVEEMTVMLNRLAMREHVGETYYAHHSSIDKKEREYVEKTLASATTPKSVAATSSLELGIDIGEIELVIQVDSTFTVSSLKQRLGRSGRKQETDQYLQLYTTTNDQLLQALAVMELLLEKWIEPARGYPVPYDVLFHQIISICQETNGIDRESLLDRLGKHPIFHSLRLYDMHTLIMHMVEKEILEVVRGSQELIVGLEGERILRSKEFYSVFMTNDEYEVYDGIKKIGQLDKEAMLSEGDNIILAGKLWTIQSIDVKKSKIFVSQAVNAKPPRYMGGAGKLHKRIPEKIMEILCSSEPIAYANEEAQDVLRVLRKPYQLYEISALQRVIWKNRNTYRFDTFTGTTIARTLVWMLRAMGLSVAKPDAFGRIEIEGDVDLLGILRAMKEREWDEAELLEHTLEEEWFLSKYADDLPNDLWVSMHIHHEVDVAGVKEFLGQYEVILISI